MFIILHAKLAILALFYGGQTSAEAGYIAQALDVVIGVFFQKVSLQVFMVQEPALTLTLTLTLILSSASDERLETTHV